MVVTSVMKQAKAKSLELMIVAFGFVAGGVWKDAIIKWLEPLMTEDGGAMALTITALIVTLVVVVLIMVLTKVLGEKEEKK
jgi:hypothetical protein